VLSILPPLSHRSDRPRTFTRRHGTRRATAECAGRCGRAARSSGGVLVGPLVAGPMRQVSPGAREREAEVSAGRGPIERGRAPGPIQDRVPRIANATSSASGSPRPDPELHLLATTNIWTPSHASASSPRASLPADAGPNHFEFAPACGASSAYPTVPRHPRPTGGRPMHLAAHPVPLSDCPS